MAGWNLDDSSSKKSKCIYCDTEFVPWMRLEYEYSDSSDAEVERKKQRVQNEYLSPVVLRSELIQKLSNTDI